MTDNLVRTPRRWRRTALRAAVASLIAAAVGLVGQGSLSAVAAGPCAIRNPVVAAGADPSVWYGNGRYYLVQSDGLSAINLRSSATVGGLAAAAPQTIWTSPTGTDHSAETWAPELENLNGQWIIYFAAASDNGSDPATNNTHRIFAITANSSDPMGTWSFFGKITDSTDQWAIDPTVFFYSGNWWMLWSGTLTGSGGTAPQQIFIAHMRDPLHIDQDFRRLIANPDQSWETSVAAIEEGPEAFISPTGTLTIVYNANASWTTSYSLGELRYHGGDLTTYASYDKVGPVFASANGVYGPGGASIPVPGNFGGGWFIYHANTSSAGGWGSRAIFTQPQTWNGNGTPNFGSAPAGYQSFDENSGQAC